MLQRILTPAWILQGGVWWLGMESDGWFLNRPPSFLSEIAQGLVFSIACGVLLRAAALAVLIARLVALYSSERLRSGEPKH